MWNASLYATMVVVATVAIGVQGRRFRRHRAAGAGRERRAAVAVWLLVVSACLVVANTLTTLDGSGPSLSYLDRRAINLVPFQMIGDYLTEAEIGHGNAWRNLVGNLVLFAPLGASLGLHPHISARRGLVVLLLTAVGVEAVQLTLGRSTDVDDVLLNVVGGLLATTVTAALVRGLAGARHRAG